MKPKRHCRECSHILEELCDAPRKASDWDPIEGPSLVMPLCRARNKDGHCKQFSAGKGKYKKSRTRQPNDSIAEAISEPGLFDQLRAYLGRNK